MNERQEVEADRFNGNDRFWVISGVTMPGIAEVIVDGVGFLAFVTDRV